MAGRVFEDLNGNQRWEPNAPQNEPGLECFDVFLDLDRNGMLDVGEPSARTGADGTYRFDGLAPGDYTVDLLADAGYDRTTSIRFGTTTQLISSASRDHVFDPIRNVLYVTSGDRVLRRDTKTGNTLAAFAVGTSLTNLDITPDGKYLLVGEGTVDTNSGTGVIYKIDLESNSVSTIPFAIAPNETGVFDLVAVNNGRALFTTSSSSTGRVRLREVDINGNTVGLRSDAFAGGAGLIRPDSRLDRNANRSSILLIEAKDDPGTIYQFDPTTNSFPRSKQLNAALDNARVSISRDGKMIAVESAGTGFLVLNEQLAVVQTLNSLRGGVAFDPARDILYAADTVNDQLVALSSNTWTELYRQAAGEDLLESGAYAEMQVGPRAKYLSYTTPSGIRYVQIDRALPTVTSLTANQVVQDIDFGYWWNGENRRPKSTDDLYTVNEDTTLSIFAPGVLGNDSDREGNALTVLQEAATQYGQLVLHADGSFSYSPNLNFTGTDQFTYWVRDSALQSCRAVTALITVQAVNDPPTIDPQSLHVPENAGLGDIVGTVIAGDRDGNGKLHFAIVDGNTDGVFAIASDTGVITIAQSDYLNYETRTRYELTVKVTDEGTPPRSSTGVVTIELEDVNEVGPAVLDEAFTVPENSTVVGTIRAQDTERGDPLTFEIFGSTADLFEVASNGELRVAPGKQLDFEKFQYHLVSVGVTDSASPPITSFATIEVFLTDVNEFSPTVTHQIFEIPENPPLGLYVGQVLSSDDDTQQSLTYEIVAGNGNQGLEVFSIDSMSGVITVADPSLIDSESAARFDLTVRVSDTGNPLRSSSTVATIVIGDRNEFPPLVDDQTFSVNENAPNGTVVGTIFVSDPDGNDLYSLRIAGGSGAFTIDSQGRITVTDSSALNFESSPTHLLTVEVSDDLEQSTSDRAVITIQLVDQNEFAPVVPSLEFTIPESSPDGTIVGTVSATDADGSQKISFAIGGGNDGGAFAINGTTGQITVANHNSLSAVGHPLYTLTVIAADNGNPQQAGTGTVKIHVTGGSNSNDHAPLINNQLFEIDENVPSGTLVGVVLARDLDPGQSLSFAITGGNTSGAFAIDSDSGDLTVANAAAVDFELHPRFRLTVLVTDDGSPSKASSATVTVDVRDVNDPPIAITLDNNTVRKHIVAALVGHVSVRDQDVNDKHTLSVDDGRFEINFARELRVAKGTALGDADGPDITVNITATDLGGASLTQPFVIHVIGNTVSNDRPWQNPRNRYDVSDDGAVAPIDALLIINEINNPQYSDATGLLQTPRPDIPGLPYYDVNGDGFVTAIDVLIVVNHLNNPSAESPGGEGEGESAGNPGFDSGLDPLPAPMRSNRLVAMPFYDFTGPMFEPESSRTLIVSAPAARSSHTSSLATQSWFVSSRPTSTLPPSTFLTASAKRLTTDESFNRFESALDEIAEDIADRWGASS